MAAAQTVMAAAMTGSTLLATFGSKNVASRPHSFGLPTLKIPCANLSSSRISRQAKAPSGRSVVVRAEYRTRSGGGAGDFLAGFFLGGVLFGAIGYLAAPVISKTIAAAEKEIEEDEEVVGPPKKLPKYADDDEGLESTRKSLNEKIAQLNAAIDDVSAQLRADDGSFGLNESAVELESAA